MTEPGGRDYIKKAIESVRKTEQDLKDLGLGDTERAKSALEKQAQRALQDATERQREEDVPPPAGLPVDPAAPADESSSES